MQIYWRSLLAVVVSLLCGCGYTFQGSGSVLPPDVKTVYVPSVENNTTEAILTPLITEALRDRFDRFGAVTVVESISGADAELIVKVLTLKRSSDTTTSRTDNTLQQFSTLTLSAELRRVSGAVLWKNPKFTFTYSYGTSSQSVVTTSARFASGNLSSSDLSQLDSREVSRGQEQQVFGDMAEAVAKKIYEDAVVPEF